MRTPLMVGNWKMNGSGRECADLAHGVAKQLEGVQGVEVAVCPPHIHLSPVREALEGSPIRLGAQNCHWEAKGAFTGEISPVMLREAGCRFVILGHSERRHIMGETNDQIRRKLRACLAHDLTPILCVGELLEERSMGVTQEVVDRQMEKGLEGSTAAEASGLILAYEPVWAIGTGKTATPRQAADVHRFLRRWLTRKYGEATAQTVRILYGGSVTPENVRELMAEENVDGALVGGASLQVHSFVSLVRVRS